MKSILPATLLILGSLTVECRLLHGPKPQTDIPSAINSANFTPASPFGHKNYDGNILNKIENVQIVKIRNEKSLIGSICGGEYSSSSGTIRHPSTSDNYQNNENCAWMIRAEQSIIITFISFDTENNYDYLRIRDGEGSEATELGVYHGTRVPSPIQVTTNQAYLLFTSDYSITRSGFEIQWEPAGSICGGEYSSTSGTIRHPSTGDNYQNNENCAWMIRAEQPIIITFIRFDTENNYDYLYVREGESIESTELGVYHGTNVPSPIQVTTNQAYLLFTSDYSITRTGFEIQWEPADVSGLAWRNDNRCGSYYLAPNGRAAECDPTGAYPCCSPHGWCGITGAHCECLTCVDHRDPPATQPTTTEVTETPTAITTSSTTTSRAPSTTLIPGSVPAGFEVYNNRVIRRTNNSDSCRNNGFGSQADWDNCMAFCNKFGAKPFIPRDTADFQLYRTVRTGLDYYMWLPANDRIQEGRLQWYNGEVASDVSALNWGSGQALSYNSEDRDCVHYSGSTSGGAVYIDMWYCHGEAYPPICEMI